MVVTIDRASPSTGACLKAPRHAKSPPNPPPMITHVRACHCYSKASCAKPGYGDGATRRPPRHSPPARSTAPTPARSTVSRPRRARRRGRRRPRERRDATAYLREGPAVPRARRWSPTACRTRRSGRGRKGSGAVLTRLVGRCARADRVAEDARARETAPARRPSCRFCYGGSNGLADAGLRRTRCSSGGSAHRGCCAPCVPRRPARANQALLRQDAVGQLRTIPTRR